MSLFDKFEKNAVLYNSLSAIGKNPFAVVMEEVLGPTRQDKGARNGARRHA